MRRLTGKATDMMVASKAQARLTIAIEVKAASNRHPGLNFSISSGLDFPNGSTLFSVISGSIASDLVIISEPADGSISVAWFYTVMKQVCKGNAS